MTLYKQKNSKIFWINLVNPVTKKRIRKSTKTSNKQEAELIHAELITSFNAIKRPNQSENTYNQAKERWLLEKGSKASTATDGYQFKRMDKFFDGLLLSDMDKPLIKKYLDSMVGEYANPTINRHRALILGLLNKAHKDWEWITEVPFVKKYEEQKVRVKFLTREQVEALMKELPFHLEMMARFSLETGLRQSNVKNLKWSEIDFERKYIICQAENMKNGKYLNVPLNKRALQVLDVCKDMHSEYVFTYEGNAPIQTVSSRAWRKALKRCNLEGFRWHDLRHTWASWHVQNGTPLAVLKEFGGWSSLDMVMKYAHLGQNHLHKYAENI